MKIGEDLTRKIKFEKIHNSKTLQIASDLIDIDLFYGNNYFDFNFEKNCINSEHLRYLLDLYFDEQDVKFLKDRVTPDSIDNLNQNEIFVFGSNIKGEHFGGAAKLAFEKFGATFGQGEGLQGQSYAIPTMDYYRKPFTLSIIKKYIYEFLQFARNYPEYKFYLTKLGCGICGYTIIEIGQLLIDFNIPKNVALPIEFWEIINEFQ